jgi:hypothetical protein
MDGMCAIRYEQWWMSRWASERWNEEEQVALES